MTAAKRVAPDPGRDDLRAKVMWRLRARLMAAFAEIEAKGCPGIETLYSSAYFMDLLTNPAGDIREDELPIHEAVNAWLWLELALLDPAVLGRHLLESESAIRSQLWRKSLIGVITTVVGLREFPPAKLSPALCDAARRQQFAKFGNRKLAILGWKLLNLMDLPGEVSARLRQLLNEGAVGS